MSLKFNPTTGRFDWDSYPGSSSLNSTYLQISKNLSDVNNVATSRTNLGLGTIATQNANAVAITGGSLTGVTLASLTTNGPIYTSAGNGTLNSEAQLALARGGTNANLVASNGGIVYSTASALAILGGTATANQVLLSGLSTTPAWSTATYPATTTINQILYSSAANTIAGLTTANSSILVTDSGGIPSLSTTLPAFTMGGTLTLGANTLALASATVSGTPTWSSNQAITLSTAAQPNITSVGTLTSLAVSGTTTITSASANALAVGRQGATNPVLQIDASTTSVVTGISIKGAGTGAGVAITAISSSVAENVTLDALGTGTFTINGTATGAITLGRATTITTGALTVSSGNLSVTGAGLFTSANANAFRVGPNGATNPSFHVATGVASAATGLKITSAAAAGGLAVAVISSGTPENLTIDALGTGTITLNGTATGGILLGKTITSYNGIATVSNGVPSELAKIDTTGLTANVTAATLYAVPASGAGMYRVSSLVVETTAGSVSSTLPNVQIVYTDNETGGSITIDATPVLGVAGIGQTGALTANTIGTTSTGVIVINAKASTTIQYQTVNYASTSAGMAYALHIKLEAL